MNTKDKIEKLNLDEFQYTGNRFQWEDEWDLGNSIRRIENKINELIDVVNELQKMRRRRDEKRPLA